MSWSGRAFPMVIAAPSGAGKTTLARALVERGSGLTFALSATTRPPRPAERDGRDYRFVDDVEFDRMIGAGELLEWAKVHAHRYGTLREGVAKGLDAGNCVVLDIDVQGARRVREVYDDAVLVFVLPPSAEELARRLASRGTEADGEKKVRFGTALAELGAVNEFHYIVVNDDFETAVHGLDSIVEAERHRRTRYVALDERVAKLERHLQNTIGGVNT